MIYALEERKHMKEKRGTLISSSVIKAKPWRELAALCVMLLQCFISAREHTECGFPS